MSLKKSLETQQDFHFGQFQCPGKGSDGLIEDLLIYAGPLQDCKFYG